MVQLYMYFLLFVGMSGSLEDRLAARLFTEERPDTPESVVSSIPASQTSPELERDLVYSVGVDQDVTHMESMLDKWTYQLKKDIMVRPIPNSVSISYRNVDECYSTFGLPLVDLICLL